MKAGFFVLLGLLMLLLGIVGAFLPVMPTTIFLILAAWCFGRSSPRLEAWMLDHPRFGSVIRDWREHGAMGRRAKWMAWSGMALGYCIFWLWTAPSPWLAFGVGLFMVGSAIWIFLRPEPKAATRGKKQAGRRAPDREKPGDAEIVKRAPDRFS